MKCDTGDGLASMPQKIIQQAVLRRFDGDAAPLRDQAAQFGIELDGTRAEMIVGHRHQLSTGSLDSMEKFHKWPGDWQVVIGQPVFMLLLIDSMHNADQIDPASRPT